MEKIRARGKPQAEPQPAQKRSGKKRINRAQSTESIAEAKKQSSPKGGVVRKESAKVLSTGPMMAVAEENDEDETKVQKPEKIVAATKGKGPTPAVKRRLEITVPHLPQRKKHVESGAATTTTISASARHESVPAHAKLHQQPTGNDEPEAAASPIKETEEPTSPLQSVPVSPSPAQNAAEEIAITPTPPAEKGEPAAAHVAATPATVASACSADKVVPTARPGEEAVVEEKAVTSQVESPQLPERNGTEEEKEALAGETKTVNETKPASLPMPVLAQSPQPDVRPETKAPPSSISTAPSVSASIPATSPTKPSAPHPVIKPFTLPILVPPEQKPIQSQQSQQQSPANSSAAASHDPKSTTVLSPSQSRADSPVSLRAVSRSCMEDRAVAAREEISEREKLDPSVYAAADRFDTFIEKLVSDAPPDKSKQHFDASPRRVVRRLNSRAASHLKVAVDAAVAINSSSVRLNAMEKAAISVEDKQISSISRDDVKSSDPPAEKREESPRASACCYSLNTARLIMEQQRQRPRQPRAPSAGRNGRKRPVPRESYGTAMTERNGNTKGCGEIASPGETEVSGWKEDSRVQEQELEKMLSRCPHLVCFETARRNYRLLMGQTPPRHYRPQIKVLVTPPSTYKGFVEWGQKFMRDSRTSPGRTLRSRKDIALRRWFEFYLRILGNPECDLEAIYQHTKDSSPPPGLKPEHIARMARRLGLDPVHDPDLLWIPYQQLSSPVPSDSSAEGIKDEEKRFDTISQLKVGEHPGDVYFFYLLHVARQQHREAGGDPWLPFHGRGGSTYYYNFATKEISFVSPDLKRDSELCITERVAIGNARNRRNAAGAMFELAFGLMQHHKVHFLAQSRSLSTTSERS